MPRENKKKTPAPPPPALAQNRFKVFRDTSEHDNHGWIFEQNAFCEGTVEKNLFTADYSISVGDFDYYDRKILVIERKGAVNELASNICQKEGWADFKDELQRLEEFRFPFVVCEFPFSLLSTYPVGSGIPKKFWQKIRVTPQFLLKRIEEIFLHFKTKFIFTDNPNLAKEVAQGIFKRIIEHVRPEQSA